jgi:hypothetical protein
LKLTVENSRGMGGLSREESGGSTCFDHLELRATSRRSVEESQSRKNEVETWIARKDLFHCQIADCNFRRGKYSVRNQRYSF